MNIVADILVSVVLLFIGFIGVYNYLNKKKWNTIDKNLLKMSRNKIIYLSIGFLISTILVVLFQVIYRQPFLTQIKLLILINIIIPCAATDYRVHKIPNQFIVFALALRVVVFVAEIISSFSAGISTLIDSAIGAGIVAGFFFLILLIFKNSIGMGDVKLFAIMGLYQGLWGTVNSVFFSLLVSFLVAIFLLITKKKGRKDVISFGPSILLGTFIAIAISGM